jgi:aconitate hydratase 2/2-methylisocitrate dehydratase
MDQAQLESEGYYKIYEQVGARCEMPGCSLCMGNQARVADKSTVISTSTRNYPNRLGKDANVYLASAELSAVTAIQGKIPTWDEYKKYSDEIHATEKDTFRYMNFDQLKDFQEASKDVDLGPEYADLLEKELKRLKTFE